MKKQELVSAVAKCAGITNQQAELALAGLAVTVADTLKAGDEVTIPGLGKLSAKAKPARTGRNPATGEPVQIAAHNVVKFTPLKLFKEAVK